MSNDTHLQQSADSLGRELGMARDDGHDAALEDHEQRIEALEASDE